LASLKSPLAGLPVRLDEIDDNGDLLGTYQGRGDANKGLKKIA
jgi:hypothetical protein